MADETPDPVFAASGSVSSSGILQPIVSRGREWRRIIPPRPPLPRLQRSDMELVTAMSTSPAANGEGSADNQALQPSKRPRTMSKACEACRVKKSRCDSSRPQCDNCRRKGSICVYREKGQPGIKPGHGKAMESRLALLENNMERMNESIQDVLNHVRNQAVPADVQTAQQAGPSMPSHREPTESQTAISDPVQWQSTSLLPDMPPFSQTALMEAIPPPYDETRINPVEHDLPPEDVLREAVDLFFEMVHPWLPLFHQQSFTDQMYQPGRSILLHAIVIISLRFWRRDSPSIEDREAYVKVSRDQLLLQTIDTCTLVSTQALALLALDAIGKGTGPKTWNTMSMLVCAARHLNLPMKERLQHSKNTPLVRNEHSEDEMSMPPVESEERRRLFWVIYTLDRFSSVSHGQAGGINMKNVRVSYPLNDGDWRQIVTPEWFQYIPPGRLTHTHCPNRMWHYSIDLLALMDRSNQLLIQPVNLTIPVHCQEWKNGFRRLDLTLSTWLHNLPREDREPPAIFDPMWVMAHAIFHLIRVRLFTVAAFPSTTSPYLKPSAAARTSCRQAIRDIVCLTASLEPSQLDRLGPMFAFVVWVASRSLLILWTTGYERSYGAMPADLETLLAALRQLAILWPSAQRYSDIIQLVLDTKGNSGGPTILDIFNDTRHTAHGLHDRLGPVSARPFSGYIPQSLDFLDMPSLIAGDMPTPWNLGTLGSEISDEWL